MSERLVAFQRMAARTVRSGGKGLDALALLPRFGKLLFPFMDQWGQREEALFNAALRRPVEERQAYLQAMCGGTN